MFTRVNSRCAHHVRPPAKALNGSGYGSARLVRFLFGSSPFARLLP
jgi:hypothetical protein